MLDYRMELAWAAGFWDGEGCTHLNTDGRTGRRFLRVAVANTEADVIERFHAAVSGRGRVTIGQPGTGGRRRVWYWRASSKEARAIFADLRPYLSRHSIEQFDRRDGESYR